jgi:uncharacterized protein
MEAAALLRRARAASALSQTEYAATVGVSQPVISAYENGRREPSIAMLERLISGSGQRLRMDLVWPASDIPPAVDEAAHAERLLDVLSLADAIPRFRTETSLAMPRMVSTR